MKRSYKQNCALANALDLVGERWTLLIVRELLIAPRRYGELLDNLPGMGTNLLANRLKEMQAAGLISKADGRYRLTDLGARLEEVVHALVRFALPMDVPAAPGSLHRSEWDAVALAAIYDSTHDSGLQGRYALELEGQPFVFEKSSGAVSVRPGTTDTPQLSVSLNKDTAQQLGSGEITFDDAFASGLVKIDGRKAEAKRLLKALSIVRR